MPYSEHPDTLTRAAVLTAVSRCLPGLGRVPEVTFLGDPRMDEVWENWAHAVFHSRILPAIREVTHHARHGRIREVIAADRCLDASLVAPLAVRSRAAGAIVAAHQQCPDGERILRRYLAAHRCARTPGHLAVVVAVRAAVFHLPEPMVLAAYLAAETKSLPSPLSWQRISSCMAQISESTSHLQAA